MSTARSIRWTLKAFLLLLAVGYFVARYFLWHQPNFSALAEERSRLAKTISDEIHFAVVWPERRDNRGFLRGVALAVELLNAKGGVLGVPLTYDVFPDKPETPREIVANTKTTAVIGHESSDMAIPASITYQYSGLLYISPFASDVDLTQHGFSLLFRSSADDRSMIEHLVAEMVRAGMNKIAVIGVRSHYGRSLVRQVDELCADADLRINFSSMYDQSQTEFNHIAYKMKEAASDAIFLADMLPRAALVIAHLREQYNTVPILSSDGLDSVVLWEEAGGKAANGTFIASAYELPPGGDDLKAMLREARTEEERVFLERYYGKHKELPGTYAVSGFDAVLLYAQALERGQTVVPLLVSSTLKYEGPWKSVLGEISFDALGNVLDKPVFIKEMKDGQFVNQKEEDACHLCP